jgi:thioredoxin reductase
VTRERFVIVGASLAGRSTAVTLREKGFNGDLILATKVPILSWRNLDPDPAVLFWMLRD